VLSCCGVCDVAPPYDLGTGSEMFKKIEGQVNRLGEAAAKSEFFEQIEKVFGTTNEITNEERGKLMQVIFARLQSIGISSLI